VLPVLIGCNRGTSGLAPAAGIVTLNGVPIEGVTVSFAPMPGTPNARSASAVTDHNGRFVASTITHGDGMPPGEYQVFLTKETGTGGDGPAGSNTADDRRIVNHLPTKYNDRDTSGLTVSIPPKGDRNIELNMEGEVDLTPRSPGGPRR